MPGVSRLLQVGLAVLASGVVVGCYQEIRIDDPDGSPPPWDAGPPAPRFMPPPGACQVPTGVDLLLVVDNSRSTVEEQAAWTAELPALAESLVHPPDADGDGELDWLPVADLRIGVVTPDMGTGGHTVPTCARSDFGDDGVLRTIGRDDIEGCESTYPRFVDFSLGGPTTAVEFARAVGCVASVGTSGCGFEQPLEAALKALVPLGATRYTVPTYTPPAFFRGASGQGERVNIGFVRDDSLLAIVVLTDEDDCSARDPELFNPSSGVYGRTDLNLRCFVHADEALHPVSRYVEGLTALRAGREDLLAFAVIGGVPPDLVVPVPTEDNFREILDDPRMLEQIDPANPTQLLPSCDVASGGIAVPPRRLVQVAQALGPSRATVQSICGRESIAAARGAIARLIGVRACQVHGD